jgi:hypothetical protein
VAEIKEHIRLPECGKDTVLADLADVIWVGVLIAAAASFH